MTLTQTLETEAKTLKIKHETGLDLARIYAIQIESAIERGDLKALLEFGKSLHALLKDLGMTQTVQALEKGGGENVVKTTSALQQLRANANSRRK